MKTTRHILAASVRQPVGVITCSLTVLGYLCENALPDEVEQYEAMTGRKWDSDAAAVGYWQSGPFHMAVAGPDNLPVCAGGFTEIAPGVGEAWMVGTPDGWRNHWRLIHRATRWFHDALLDSGRFTRLEVDGLTSRTEACRWYERLGMKFEGIRRGRAGGRDVSMYARTVEVE